MFFSVIKNDCGEWRINTEMYGENIELPAYHRKNMVFLHSYSIIEFLAIPRIYTLRLPLVSKIRESFKMSFSLVPWGLY